MGAAIDLALNLLAAQRQLGPSFNLPRAAAAGAGGAGGAPGGGPPPVDTFDGRVVVLTGGPITSGPGALPHQLLQDAAAQRPGAKPSPPEQAAAGYLAYLAQSAAALECPVDVVAGGRRAPGALALAHWRWRWPWPWPWRWPWPWPTGPGQAGVWAFGAAAQADKEGGARALP
jgi:hypothetical protein